MSADFSAAASVRAASFTRKDRLDKAERKTRQTKPSLWPMTRPRCSKGIVEGQAVAPTPRRKASAARRILLGSTPEACRSSSGCASAPSSHYNSDIALATRWAGEPSVEQSELSSEQVVGRSPLDPILIVWPARDRSISQRAGRVDRLVVASLEIASGAGADRSPMLHPLTTRQLRRKQIKRLLGPRLPCLGPLVARKRDGLLKRFFRIREPLRLP